MVFGSFVRFLAFAYPTGLDFVKLGTSFINALRDTNHVFSDASRASILFWMPTILGDV